MIGVPSSDDVVVALHELAGAGGAAHPVVLIAHATGFHGHAYLPVATRLAPRFHTFALDFRGHGDTPRPPDWQVDWDRYGDDAVAAAEALASRPGAAGGLIGFGHSMGGAGLLMAAARRPGLFRLLVVFEPIVHPSDRAGAPTTESPLVAGARRRRPVFDSFEAAVANYASKPPLAAFDPEALDAYVRFGLRPDGEHLRLKCEPEHEARTFEQGGQHHTWDGLASIDIPVVVAAGRIEEAQPSAISEAVADALPHGRFVLDGSLDHFGPFTRPGYVADLIAAGVDDLADGPPPL
jgi:pimeloyl-ACP methyl ester carboxylesterase